MDCTNINVLVVILYYSFVKCNYWGKLGKVHRISQLLITTIYKPIIILNFFQQNVR